MFGGKLKVYNEKQLDIIENHISKYFGNYEQVFHEKFCEIITLSKRIVKILKFVYSPVGYSIIQNGGVFNDIGHYHLHVFPRYKDDGFGWKFGDAVLVVVNVADLNSIKLIAILKSLLLQQCH